jgi:hypothetical protein
MNKPTPKELQESIEFIANSISSYTNSLDVVVRKPYAEHAGLHMQRLIIATQEAPKEEQKKAKEKK